MYPANAEQVAPIKKQIAVCQGKLSAGKNIPKTRKTATTKMAKALYCRLKNAIAPSCM
jgi:hypothetical protein